MNVIATFLSDERGSTAVEYGLILSLIAVAVIVTLGTLGQNIASTFQTVAAELGTVAGG